MQLLDGANFELGTEPILFGRAALIATSFPIAISKGGDCFVRGFFESNCLSDGGRGIDYRLRGGELLPGASLSRSGSASRNCCRRAGYRKFVGRTLCCHML